MKSFALKFLFISENICTTKVPGIENFYHLLVRRIYTSYICVYRFPPLLSNNVLNLKITTSIFNLSEYIFLTICQNIWKCKAFIRSIYICCLSNKYILFNLNFSNRKNRRKIQPREIWARWDHATLQYLASLK